MWQACRHLVQDCYVQEATSFKTDTSNLTGSRMNQAARAPDSFSESGYRPAFGGAVKPMHVEAGRKAMHSHSGSCCEAMPSIGLTGTELTMPPSE
tara:strand:+ start:10762 stop:11046 length:285 start_codon:yes stop_codon:yes gene_type:complete